MTDADADRQVVEWRSFRVGEKVRVNPSPECRVCRRPGWQSESPGHSPDEAGLTGVIADEDEPPFSLWPRHHFPGHPYCVDFGRPIHIDGTYSYGAMYYAANELEPVEPVAQPTDSDEDRP